MMCSQIAITDWCGCRGLNNTAIYENVSALIMYVLTA